MSNCTFLPTNILETKNPNPQTSYTYIIDNYDHRQDFELPEYFPLLDHPEEDAIFSSAAACLSRSPALQEMRIGNSFNSISNIPRNSHMQVKFNSDLKRDTMDVGRRIAFRTQSNIEIMDDGFKWRKYGKKMVKNSPNPRNYYKCSTEGCNVKKRVERDREDSSYVITTYEGMHNHESPCIAVCRNEMPFPPSGWTLQASHPSS